jgi:hypothetical protein
MGNEASRSDRTAGPDERGQLGRLMRRRLKALEVLARGKTGTTRYRSGIGKARITATTLGQKLREQPIGHHATDYRRDRFGGPLTLTGKADVSPARELERTWPIASSGAGRDLKGASGKPLRRPGSLSQDTPAKNRNAIDRASLRLPNRVAGNHGAGRVSAGAHAKLADVIAAGAGNQGVGRKGLSAAARSDAATLEDRTLDSHVRRRGGVLRSRKAPALTAVGAQWENNRLSPEHSTVAEFERGSSVSLLRGRSNRRPTQDGPGSGHWNGYPNAPRDFGRAGKDYDERRQSKPVSREAYGDSGAAASARYAERRSERAQPALTINFSPSVVLQGMADQESKRNIVEALALHSHELVLLIEREIAKQRRVEF